MQSSLRTKIAAVAMLLVPAGALIAAGPAAAAQRWEQGDHYQAQRWAPDRQAPQIFDVSPTQGVSERGLTRIGARFNDDRSGVDLRTVTLRVDGRNVTGGARVDLNDVHYAADLRPGRHSAEVLVRDRAGNLARRSWTFDVMDHGRGHDRVGYGYGNGYGRR
jgi:hypothetical protein